MDCAEGTESHHANPTQQDPYSAYRHVPLPVHVRDKTSQQNKRIPYPHENCTPITTTPKPIRAVEQRRLRHLNRDLIEES
jgi:hypothetical protein